jgi:hypothetical protein
MSGTPEAAFMDAATTKVRISYGKVTVILDCPSCVGSYYYRCAPATGDTFFRDTPLMMGSSAVPVFDLDRRLRRLFAIDGEFSFPVAVAVKTDFLDPGQKKLVDAFVGLLPGTHDSSYVAFAVSAETAIAQAAVKPLPPTLDSILSDSGIRGVSFPGENSVAWHLDPLALMLRFLSKAGNP